MQAIARWAHGDVLFPEFTWDATKAIAYLISDRNVEEAASRATALGIPDNKIQFYSIVNDKAIHENELLAPKMLLEKILDKKFTIDFDLLVIDPIGLFINGNLNSYQTVARSMMILNRIAIEKNITIIGTHHSTKAKHEVKFRRPQDRISGSSALLGYSGTQMVLVPTDEDDTPYDTFYIISHTHEPMKIEMERGQNGYFNRAPVTASNLRRIN